MEQISNLDNAGNAFSKINRSMWSSQIKGFSPSSKYHYSNIRAKKQTNILFVGDSLITSFQYPLYDDVNNYYGLSGLGYQRLEGGQYLYHRITLAGDATYYEDLQSEDEWGVSGDLVKIGSGGSLEYQHLDSGGNVHFPFTDFTIYYCKRSGGGSFRWRYDDGNWNTVDTSVVGESELGIIETNLSVDTYPQNHKIDIENVSGEVWIYGVRTWNSYDTMLGLTIDFIHQGGSKASEWAVYTKHWQAFVVDVKHDNINIWLGLNDANTPRTNEQLIGDIDTIVTGFTLNARESSNVTLFNYYEPGTDGALDTVNSDKKTILDGYASEIVDYCLANNISWLDIDWLFPSRALGNSSDMDIWNDASHLNSNGGNYLSKKLLEIISLPTQNALMSKSVDNKTDKSIYLKAGEAYGFFKYNSDGSIELSDVKTSASVVNYYIDVNSGRFQFREYFGSPVPVRVPSYTVANLPDAATYFGCLVEVTNEAGGRQIAYSDATNWRRISDGAIVSA